jgi:ribonucleoside-diphosphate reductase subunit M2
MGDSPAKKLNFEPAGKENVPLSSPTCDILADVKPVPLSKPAIHEAPKVALGIKELEASEPLLQENPHRFVLFPIKYHEVGDLPVACHALGGFVD